MINPKLIGMCGEEGKDFLTRLALTVGDIVAPTVKVITESGFNTVNGIKLPSEISTSNIRAEFVQKCVEEVLKTYGIRNRDAQICVWGESFKAGGIPICVPDSVVTMGTIEYMVNPELLDMLESKSRGILTNLIAAIGNEVAGRVSVLRDSGYHYVNYVKMPCALVVEEEYANLVRDIVDEFYDNWGDDAHRGMVDVYDDRYTKGDFPLCISVKDAESIVHKRHKYEVNSVLTDMYGMDSRNPLNRLIELIGDDVAPSVEVSGRCGCKYIEGVKMPNMLITNQENIERLRIGLDRFIKEFTGGDNDDVIFTSIKPIGGEIPLCVEFEAMKEAADVKTKESMMSILNAAAIMGD